MRLSEFARLCGGELMGFASDADLAGFSFDTRTVRSGELFVAVKGASLDGHDHVQEALSRGAVGSLVERPVEVPHLLVPNVREALVRVGVEQRSKFTGAVVGVTGSNGKTSCKEFLAGALAPLGHVLKSPGNWNTELTAPLVWTGLTDETQVVVSEMAMRGMGQIDHLATWIRPHIGLITMIGTAHIEMLGSREKIAEAKGEILQHLPKDGLAVLWAEDDFISLHRSMAPCPVLTFGEGPDADCKVVGYRALDLNTCEVRLAFRGEFVEFKLPTLGKHQARNAAAALAVAVHLGVDMAAAAAGIEASALPPMRMEVQDRGGITVLLDNYNASPDSMIAGLKTLSELPARGRRVAILGEMRELGDMTEHLHRTVGKALAVDDSDEVILFGDSTKFLMEEALAHGFPPSKIRQIDSLEAIRAELDQLESGDLVFIKGSRALYMEKALAGWRE